MSSNHGLHLLPSIHSFHLKTVFYQFSKASPTIYFSFASSLIKQDIFFLVYSTKHPHSVILLFAKVLRLFISSIIKSRHSQMFRIIISCVTHIGVSHSYAPFKPLLNCTTKSQLFRPNTSICPRYRYKM